MTKNASLKRMIQRIIHGLEEPMFSTKGLTVPAGSRRFRKALNFLKKHYDKPVGTRDLCKAAKLSRRGLHKAFQQYVGQGPGRALRRMRIERAKELLLNTGHELKVIAKMCGYRNQNSFWVSFRDAAGEAPGKFRRRMQKALALNKSISGRNPMPVPSGAKGIILLSPELYGQINGGNGLSGKIFWVGPKEPGKLKKAKVNLRSV